MSVVEMAFSRTKQSETKRVVEPKKTRPETNQPKRLEHTTHRRLQLNFSAEYRFNFETELYYSKNVELQTKIESLCIFIN